MLFLANIQFKMRHKLIPYVRGPFYAGLIHRSVLCVNGQVQELDWRRGKSSQCLKKKCISYSLVSFYVLKQSQRFNVAGQNSTGKNQPHQSGFNLENKNKKKWTLGETNTWSKSENSLLFEQWPDKIAQSYQHKMNSQRNLQEEFHQSSGREKINPSNHI